MIGADQVLALRRSSCSASRRRGEARAQLSSCAGKTHELHTRGGAWPQAGKIVWSARRDGDAWPCAPSPMPSSTATWRRCGARVCQTVGAYEIEGRGIQLFERVEGDTFTIIGLPLLPLLAELRARGAIET